MITLCYTTLSKELATLYLNAHQLIVLFIEALHHVLFQRYLLKILTKILQTVESVGTFFTSGNMSFQPDLYTIPLLS